MQLVYDHDCPACDYFCQRVDIVETAGELNRIDARQSSDVLEEVTQLGLDIDEGMVLKLEDKIYYGSDAIHALAQLSSRRGVINRLAYWTFRNPGIARTLYPVLAACRNLLLKLLRRTRINNLDIEGNDRF